MRIWEVAFEIVMDTTEPDVWSKIDTYTVAANSIEEAITKTVKKASQEWDKRPVRIYKVELSAEVDVE